MRVVIIRGGVMYRFLVYMIAMTSICYYTQEKENVLYQTMRSKLVTVEPKSLYCVPNVGLCSHISVLGKWLVLNCPLFGGFT